MYRLETTTRFKKDLKKIKRIETYFKATTAVLKMLQQGGVVEVPEKMRPHLLKGNYKNHWECHIKPDLLIIWFQVDEQQVIRLIRIGSHSELFK